MPLANELLLQMGATGEALSYLRGMNVEAGKLAGATDRSGAGLNKQEATLTRLRRSWTEMNSQVELVSRTARAVTQTVELAWNAAKESANREDLARFVAETDGAAEALARLTRGTRGMVDDDALAKEAMRIADLGLSMRDVQNAATVAAYQAVRTGESAEAAISKVLNALASERYGALRKMGVDIKGAADASDALAEAAARMGKRLDESASVGMVRVERQIGDIADAALDLATTLTGLKEVPGIVFGPMDAFLRRVEEQQERARKAAGYHADTFGQLVEHYGELAGFTRTVDTLARSWSTVAANMDAAVTAQRALSGLTGAGRTIGGAFASIGTGVEGIGLTFWEVLTGQRKPPPGGGRSGGSGGGGTATPIGGGVIPPNWAEQFGFGGAEADFLGGFSAGTLAGGRETYMPGLGVASQNGTADPGAMFRDPNDLQSAIDGIERWNSTAQSYIETSNEMATATKDMWAAIADASGSQAGIKVMKAFAAAELAIASVSAGFKSAESFALATFYGSLPGQEWRAPGLYAAGVQFAVLAASKGVQAIASLASIGAGSGGRGGGASRGASWTPGTAAPVEKRDSAPVVLVFQIDRREFARGVVDSVNAESVRAGLRLSARAIGSSRGAN